MTMPPLPEAVHIRRSAHGFTHSFSHLQMDAYGRECAQAAVNYADSAHKRMFEAACIDLGSINECLGLDPGDGGAKPIIDAINRLKKLADQGQRLAISVMTDNGHMFVG